MPFIDDKQILCESQYRFRTNMSTSLAVLELIEEMTTSALIDTQDHNDSQRQSSIDLEYKRKV